MNDVVEFLTSQEMIVVYIVVGVACFLCFLIYLLDKNYYKRKRKQNTKELNKLVENVEQELEQHPIVLDQVETINEEVPTNVLYVEPQTTIQTPVVKEQVLEQAPQTVQTPVVVQPVENIQPVIMPTPVEIKEAPVVEQQVQIVEPKIEKVENLVLESMISPEEELQYTDIEPNQIEAQAELKRLTEELQKAQEVTKNIDISSLEEEQEQNAIISLDELIKRSQESHFEHTLEMYEEDDEDKPISIEELEKLRTKVVTGQVEEIETPKEEIVSSTSVEPIILTVGNTEPHQEKMILDEFNNIKLEEPKPYQDTRKFKSSPVISPVYGIENKSFTNDSMELENTANYDKLDEEIKKTNEFLMTLKELQKKLD